MPKLKHFNGRFAQWNIAKDNVQYVRQENPGIKTWNWQGREQHCSVYYFILSGSNYAYQSHSLLTLNILAIAIIYLKNCCAITHQNSFIKSSYMCNEASLSRLKSTNTKNHGELLWKIIRIILAICQFSRCDFRSGVELRYSLFLVT